MNDQPRLMMTTKMAIALKTRSEIVAGTSRGRVGDKAITMTPSKVRPINHMIGRMSE